MIKEVKLHDRNARQSRMNVKAYNRRETLFGRNKRKNKYIYIYINGKKDTKELES